MRFNCLSPKKRFSRSSKKKKKLSLRKNSLRACKDLLGDFSFSSTKTTNLYSLPESLVDSHNEQLFQNSTENNNSETSSSSEYVMNSSATDESSDGMEYENEYVDNTDTDTALSLLSLSKSSPIRIQGNKPLTQPYSPLKEDTIEKIIDQLELNGFQQHCASQQGGSYSVGVIKTWACRIAKFLSYTYTVERGRILLPQDVNKWTSNIINKYYYTIFPKYVYYLGTVLQLAPKTIMNGLLDIKKYIYWFVFYRSTRKVGEKKTSTLYQIDTIIQNFTRLERKRERKRRSDAPDMDDLIANRELPAGGLNKLQEAVESDLEWFRNFKESRGMLEENTYKHFMNMLYSALYVYSPQGRISAIEDLKLHHVKDFESEGYAMSSRFKTNAAFGYQPVTTAKVSKMLLSFYINTLRPEIVKKCEDDNDHYDPSLLNSDNSPLFLNFDRSNATRIGDKVYYYCYV